MFLSAAISERNYRVRGRIESARNVLIDMDIANSQTNLTKNQSEYFGRIY